jgi:uncharacterized phage infection (PIP) family protein YhgE
MREREGIIPLMPPSKAAVFIVFISCSSVATAVVTRRKVANGTSVDAHVADLEKSLAELQERHAATVGALKENYETNLSVTERRNRASEHRNAKMAREIQQLEHSIMVLRSRASNLSDSNVQLRAQVRSAQENITTARDFIFNLLNSSNESVEATPELHILKELEQEEQETTAAKEHAQRLVEVKQSSSLLQLDVNRPHKRWQKSKAKRRAAKQATTLSETANDTVPFQAPEELLKSMVSNLDGLAEEQNNSEVAFAKSFEEEYAALAKRSQEIEREASMLNTTKEKDIEIKQRLEVAVERLNEMNVALTAARSSLFGFIRRISKKSVASSAEKQTERVEPEKMWLTRLISR